MHAESLIAAAPVPLAAFSADGRCIAASRAFRALTALGLRIEHALADDLLDVSRIAAGRMRIAATEVDLAELVHDLLQRHDDLRARAAKSCCAPRRPPWWAAGTAGASSRW